MCSEADGPWARVVTETTMGTEPTVNTVHSVPSKSTVWNMLAL